MFVKNLIMFFLYIYIYIILLFFLFFFSDLLVLPKKILNSCYSDAFFLTNLIYFIGLF